MAKARQIKDLIRCHAEGDDKRFYAIAMQVAAQEARAGHGNLAQELRDLIDEARAQARSAAAGHVMRSPVPLAKPRGDLTGLLTVVYPATRLADMALGEPLAGRLRRVIREQRQRERLALHGFLPMRKLLFVGPPGTGKTMTASALAGELGLPLFTIELDGLITKFMGETAAKLRLVFNAIAETRGVYFFDEFDALGGRRATGNDVGEIRRVLNSFLLFLETDRSDSLIIGATNHVDLLDHALFRRFDATFRYELPSSAITAEVMKGRLALLDTCAVDWDVAMEGASGLSHAELTRACELAAKGALLNDTKAIETQDLVAALDERRVTPPTDQV